MRQIKILWADDEIELLKPHIMFLEAKGYEVFPVNNGNDAISEVANQKFDIVFLDEQMPGLSGIEVLDAIKSKQPELPVIMITKSEEENIMDKAIGAQINDYLIKPINPNQIILALKKNLNKNDLLTQNTTMKYQRDFSQLGMEIANANSYEDWKEVYRHLVYWEMQLVQSKDHSMNELLLMQKNDANVNFAKFIKKNYINWFQPNCTEKPLLSPNIIKEKVFQKIQENSQTLLLVIDNLRYDHWMALRPLLSEYFTVEEDSLYYSILPTTTQYARNALFSGFMPADLEKMYPDLWVDDEDDEMKNLHEEEMLISQLKRLGYNEKIYFDKVTSINTGKKITDRLYKISQHKFSVLVHNFIDILSHARTEMNMIKELANDESAYRSLTVSWFSHSPLFELLQELSKKKINVLITTDHGSVNIQNPIKVLGDKNVTTNLRYKQGKALQYNPKEVFEITKPIEARLPKCHLSSTYIFATNQDFFAYPNNYNYYAKYYKDTFQHGGISLEEMIIPYISLKAI
ncbi:MAG: PglZ domain-containing protein [Bacteroidales bacterium]|nr:PglZ domain-containing protein [Bacteroidales bacterium]